MPKLVEIVWEDHSSSSDHGWKSIEEIVEHGIPLVCKSVGWLIKDTKDVKVIVSTMYVPDERFVTKACGDMTILTKAIKSLKVLHK